MNREAILLHLRNCGFEANLTDDGNKLTVRETIGEQVVVLRHTFPIEMWRMPQFSLVESTKFGSLAHVLPMDQGQDGSICVNDSDLLSVNFAVPAVVYEESIDRHLALLRRLILDPDWNRSELIREFRSHWDIFCNRRGSDRRLYFVSDSISNSSFQVKQPIRNQTRGIPSHFVGLSDDLENRKECAVLLRSLNWNDRQLKGKALVLQLNDLEPAPTNLESLGDWYLRCLERLQQKSANELRRVKKRHKKEYWLVFGASNGFHRVWFAIHLVSQSKKSLPTSKSEIDGWKLRPVPVHGLDPDSVVPRGGGNLSLATKSVLLVGCGSVGSELAHRLASTGLGEITLSDPESFSEENLYRHTLGITDIDWSKSLCLTSDLQQEFPWVVARDQSRRLEEFTDITELNRFDLIIVAIGSPTVERKFHDFATRNSVSTPIMNVWLEPYGIGGHTTLTLPAAKGCLLCAYVDSVELSRGLSSNLNFLEPNQDITQNRGGCGDLFIPYSAIASNYTATMSADLATRFLLGDIASSSKVSWKGDASTAQSLGLKTTYRYTNFRESLEVLPLFHPECDVCGS